jgi:flavin reductase (DIM6/NTAB) family NADH-FMN oxidoreductase RutF
MTSDSATDSAIGTPGADVPADLFRAVMGSVCTPVSVVTTFDNARPHGTTVSAFCSLSLTPPMVLVALDEGSALLQVVRGSSRFGVNVLSHEQGAIAGRFATKGDDKFRDVAWESRSDVPHIMDSACWFACDVEQLVPGGDHTIVIGRVIETDHVDLPPLTYHRRGFGTHAVSTQQTA